MNKKENEVKFKLNAKEEALRKLRWFYMKLKYLIFYQRLDFFNNINIEINTDCARRCSYCPNSIYERGLIKNRKRMKEEIYKKIIDELAELNFRGVISPTHYGEPLLDNRIFKFMKYAKKKLPNATFLIFSNGDCLTIENYNRLIESGVTHLVLTQHEGVKSNNISKLFEYLDKNSSKKIDISFNTFDKNTPLFNRGGLVHPKQILYNPVCLYANNSVVIDVDGNVILCCNDYLSTIKFGNVKKEKLIDIWKSKRYTDIRKDLLKKIFSYPICKKCVGLI
ncbi:MAG: SPASM domain-containing protein [archaeon]|nr:SPASM domain-containing protein [archaeon]